MTTSLDELARKVETLLDAQELSLTMGGEPTFIPEKPDTPEWNQEALGPQKLGYARRLASRLLDELYPGGLVMQVYGKQYPGEPLPRWVVLTLHRHDGVPLWRHPEIFLLDDVHGPNRREDGRRFVEALADELGLGGYVVPCVEKDAVESPHGWALPLDWSEDGWASDDWPFSATDPIIAVSGKSPLGLRLPLGDLEEDRVRRALTVEVHDGALDVFIPPLELESFFALIAAVERVARSEGTEGLVLCGYGPSAASAISTLGLAADPGVLEVNLPPTGSWREYDDILQRITRAAAEEGLYTLRYHLNGQVQGTGGGAHVLFGGPSLDENPFFRRPDLIASIIRFWQQHPSLSYFFSGQYVGPGSQAPRPDETLVGKLYELETACLGIDSLDGPPDRIFFDRLFRNLMTDSGGNTHRAEICVDKLWNFDSPTGLQGLIELRAFATMPEVEQQSLAALFVRAILAMLATRPCTEPLVRWDATLHDAYMLPTLLLQDLRAICADLAATGLHFDPRWLQPLLEQRFPVLGRFGLVGGEVLVRQALEPWPLMAEIADGGTTSRVVDRSTDRIEISVSNPAALGENRVVVNGVALVMREVDGTLVAGVRYKSAGGWPAFHPHIPVQSPLEIEVVDGANRVLASSRYYYWNPEAPRYDGPPADGAEARARRIARWQPSKERLGTTQIPEKPVYAAENHYTLDLRRQPPIDERAR
ncbi:MAG: transglutaminase family protein [Polyangiales bacterium]